MTEVKNEYICCDPFKIQKKKVTALICVIKKVYLSSCLVCQFPKQRLMLCHCFSVLMRRYWRCSVQRALPLAFAWFYFGTGHNGFIPFSSETLERRSRKTFVITRNDTITCLFCILNRSQQHLLILSLSMVLTQLNMWYANLLDHYYDSMARLAAFWLIIMGCLAMSPSPMPLSLSWQWLWSGIPCIVKLIHWTHIVLLWQPGGVKVRQPLLRWQLLPILPREA